MEIAGIVKGKEGKRSDNNQACFASVLSEKAKYFFPLQEPGGLKGGANQPHSNSLTLCSRVCAKTVPQHREVTSGDTTTEQCPCSGGGNIQEHCWNHNFTSAQLCLQETAIP